MKGPLNFPEQFGFISNLEDCKGKTIQYVELLKMEFGCTWDTAWAVQFTDGARAFFSGIKGSGVMNPQIDDKAYGALTVKDSKIFTLDEYLEMVKAREGRNRYNAEEKERKERDEYERMKKRFGDK